MATLIRRGAIEKPPAPDAGASVRLEPHDDPAALAGRLDALARIEVHFPTVADGRGYSLARLLRERLGFRGELRAVGDVQRDHLFNLARCGFDAVRAEGAGIRGLTASEGRLDEVYRELVEGAA